jgi:hypothetical protein
MFHELPRPLALDSVEALAHGLTSTVATLARHIGLLEALPALLPRQPPPWEIWGDPQLYALVHCMTGEAAEWLLRLLQCFSSLMPDHLPSKQFRSRMELLLADLSVRVPWPAAAPSHLVLRVTWLPEGVEVLLAHTAVAPPPTRTPIASVVVCVGTPAPIWRERLMRWGVPRNLPKGVVADAVSAAGPLRFVQPAFSVANPNWAGTAVKDGTRLYMVPADARLAALEGIILPPISDVADRLLRQFLFVDRAAGLALTAQEAGPFYCGDEVPYMEFMSWAPVMAYCVRTFVSVVVAPRAQVEAWPLELTLPRADLLLADDDPLRLPPAVLLQWRLAQALLPRNPGYLAMLLHWGEGQPALGRFVPDISFIPPPTLRNMAIILEVLGPGAGVLLSWMVGPGFGPSSLSFGRSFRRPLRTRLGRVFRAIPVVLDLTVVRANARSSRPTSALYTSMLEAPGNRFFYVYEELDPGSQHTVSRFHRSLATDDVLVTYWIGDVRGRDEGLSPDFVWVDTPTD